jgi:transposase
VVAAVTGFEALLCWGRKLDAERAWVIEDCRHVSGPLERFLLDHGETVLRLPPHLIAGARRSAREAGKSDPIDALAIARASLREGVDTLPSAQLAGVDLEIRLLTVHRERLVGSRTRLINELRWHLHDMWPEWEIRERGLIHPSLQQQVTRRLRRAQPTVRVRIARDLIARVCELTRTINELQHELGGLVRKVAPQLLAERGVGVLIAAKLIGEIGDITRFRTDAQLARLAGCAPIPVSSGRTDRYRLDRGGNRQLNHAIHLMAVAKLVHDPQTAAYIAKQRQNGKTHRDAIRSLKRHLVRRIWRLLTDPSQVPQTVCLT